jgi:hypothetical protein
MEKLQCKVARCLLVVLAVAPLACTDESPPTYSLEEGSRGHAEGFVLNRRFGNPIEGVRLSYSVSVLFEEMAVRVTREDAAIVTDQSGNYEFDWAWIGTCPEEARVEIRIRAVEQGFVPLDTARAFRVQCGQSAAPVTFYVFLTPEFVN